MTLKELIEQAAPLPWIADDRHIHLKDGLVYPRGEEPETDVIVLVDTDRALLNPTDKANLKLIAHAVNMLPKLVAALESAIERTQEARLNHESGDFDGIEIALAALIDEAGEVLDEANNPEVPQ